MSPVFILHGWILSEQTIWIYWNTWYINFVFNTTVNKLGSSSNIMQQKATGQCLYRWWWGERCAGQREGLGCRGVPRRLQSGEWDPGLLTGEWQREGCIPRSQALLTCWSHQLCDYSSFVSSALSMALCFGSADSKLKGQCFSCPVFKTPYIKTNANIIFLSIPVEQGVIFCSKGPLFSHGMASWFLASASVTGNRGLELDKDEEVISGQCLTNLNRCVWQRWLQPHTLCSLCLFSRGPECFSSMKNLCPTWKNSCS